MRGTTVPLVHGAVGLLHGGGRPPPHIEQNSRQIGIRLYRFEHEVMIEFPPVWWSLSNMID
ncbi:hypothetical protein Acsp02_97830 [Actinoplanes sp. NBRC 103695]|nr:hypothetical protein Acsp02_97830 [Actinoplanes sp. NBRC 103695]